MEEPNVVTEQFADLLEDVGGQPQIPDTEPPADEAKEQGSDENNGDIDGYDADHEAKTPQDAQGDKDEIDIAGKKYKLSELTELLKNAETWRNQLPHYQRLYEQEKQRAEQLEAIYKQQQQATAQPNAAPTDGTPITEEKLIEMYEPRIQSMIKSGAISEELYAENPALVAHFVHFQETQFKPIVEFINNYAVPAIQFLSHFAQQQQRATVSQVSEKLASILEEMAKEPDAAELKDETVAAQFVTELASMYPNPEDLTNPDVVRREWVRRNWTKYRQMVLEAAKSGGQRQQQKAMAASGQSGVRPPAPPSNGREDSGVWFEDLLAEKQMPTR